MYFFVDLQGFKTKNNRFVLKEMCLLSNNSDEEHLYIIKPPFPYNKLSFKYKKQARWLSNYFHGFDWTDGFISYLSTRKLLLSLLPKTGAIIFVKGEEKKIWIQDIFRNSCSDIDYYNIEELGYSNISSDNIVHCKYHDSKFICAYQNAVKIKKWYSQNISQ